MQREARQEPDDDQRAPDEHDLEQKFDQDEPEGPEMPE